MGWGMALPLRAAPQLRRTTSSTGMTMVCSLRGVALSSERTSAFSAAEPSDAMGTRITVLRGGVTSYSYDAAGQLIEAASGTQFEARSRGTVDTSTF